MKFTLRSAEKTLAISEIQRAKIERQEQIAEEKDRRKMARLVPVVLKRINKLIDKRARSGETYLRIDFVKKELNVLNIDYADFEKIEQEIYIALESSGYVIYKHKYSNSCYNNKICYFVIYWDGRD